VDLPINNGDFPLMYTHHKISQVGVDGSESSTKAPLGCLKVAAGDQRSPSRGRNGPGTESDHPRDEDPASIDVPLGLCI